MAFSRVDLCYFLLSKLPPLKDLLLLSLCYCGEVSDDKISLNFQSWQKVGARQWLRAVYCRLSFYFSIGPFHLSTETTDSFHRDVVQAMFRVMYKYIQTHQRTKGIILFDALKNLSNALTFI